MSAPEIPMLELKSVIGRSPLGQLGTENPFNFSLEAGQVGVVFGGKETSSLFRLVMGTGTIESGEICVEGNLKRDRNSRDSDLSEWRQRIGFGFREKGLLSNLTLLDNVDLPAKYHDSYKTGMERGSIAKNALIEAGIEESLWNLRPDRISWEVRKRVLLARSVVLNPKVIILDDPSALLASPTLPNLMAWIDKQKAKGRGILIGTNDYPFGLAVADWVLHPKKNVPVLDCADFIDDAWIRSAAMLKELKIGPGSAWANGNVRKGA